MMSSKHLYTSPAAGNSPMHYAVIGGKTAVLEFLLGKGAWAEGSNENDDTILHIAARLSIRMTIALLLV